MKVEAFAHQHCLDQEKIENLVGKLGQLERAIAMRDLQLSETEQLVRELQSCTYDGIFVWKISEFSRRRQEAVAGRMPAMFSPGERRRARSCLCWQRCFQANITLWFLLHAAFYSSKYGYKMCLRLYLNGDGTGRGTHLSLFFVVMRGKCDALLKWPFSQKVNGLPGVTSAPTIPQTSLLSSLPPSFPPSPGDPDAPGPEQQGTHH